MRALPIILLCHGMVATAGCSSSQGVPVPPTDGGDSTLDVGSGAFDSATIEDSFVDASEPLPSPNSCPKALALYCQQEAGIAGDVYPCVMSLPPDGSGEWPWPLACVSANVQPCGGFTIITYQGFDLRFVSFFYSSSTGTLVGIREGNTRIGDEACIAGPAQFDAPRFDSCPVAPLCAADAASDAGAD